MKRDCRPDDRLAGCGTPSLEARIAAGLAFLARVQRPNGEIPVCATSDPQMLKRLVADPSVFPTALAAHCLGFAGPAARPILERAQAFLVGEMDRNGLWRHWTREHPLHRQLPPDLDDTSCATAALAAAGLPLPENRHLMLANRTRRGLFLTWMIPRARWTGRAHFSATLPQIRHLATLIMFFRRTSAKPGDVDAVVNANVLHCLRGEEGSRAAAEWLLELLREGKESQCDKWYDNPIIVRYFLSRALAGVRPEAGEIIVRRSMAARAGKPLEAAMLASTLLDWEAAVPPRILEMVAEGQGPSGGWPAAAVYHGGRARLPRGSFSDPHPDTPRWGSEALTTAFAIEALARVQAAVRGGKSFERAGRAARAGTRFE